MADADSKYRHKHNNSHKGINWAEIARQLPGRDGLTTRQRYENTLAPKRLDAMTFEEDCKIKELHKRMGN
jgi:hypothetical protein